MYVSGLEIAPYIIRTSLFHLNNVVKGMTTLIILGNDFADQYPISLIREGSESFLLFGDTRQKTKIENSVSTPLKDGHVFNIKTLPNLASLTSKFKAHRHLKKSKKQ